MPSSSRRRLKRSPHRRLLRGWKFGALGVAVVGLGLAAVVGWLVLGGSEEGPEGPPRAAIIDQLSMTIPNPSFVDEATTKLERASYVVDYYPGDRVTVDFMRRLPAYGYDLILLRMHSDRLQGEWRGQQIDEAVLFSGEPFDETKYLDDRNEARLTRARYLTGDEELFGISPDFLYDRMLGDFDGATVIAMGCDGLSTTRMAEAFIDKGAGAFIGWDELVSASHTDAAIDVLLQHLTSGLPAEAAVERTMADVGPDPAYDSELQTYTGG
ncbi:MAG: hypothetical protein U1B78_04410 [Dehalococcoidia bacterium]|nr:hypothetical protein [Dehalococcoidia bacterium]